MNDQNKHTDLFAKVCDFKNLHSAFVQASRGKRSRPEVLAFTERLEENLIALRDGLRSGTYAQGGYRRFIVHDSKRRSIMAAPFRDRVVHHALCNVIEPLFERTFIHDSYACRRGKGTHAAVERFRQFMRRSPYRETYIFQGDISKYFDSIDHEILYGLVARRITDERVLALVRHVIASANAQRGAGIPIGNLTSQLFANVYLSELDQFAKRTLRARRYIRYMDDFLILDTDKRMLADYRGQIGRFARERLGLTLHPRKSTIVPVRLGVDFLGYRVFENSVRLRGSTVRRFSKRTRERLRELEILRGAGSKEDAELLETTLRAGIVSWGAYARHADSFRLREDLSKRLGLPPGLL
jgi:retron-type reverse transcriptase